MTQHLGGEADWDLATFSQNHAVNHRGGQEGRGEKKPEPRAGGTVGQLQGRAGIFFTSEGTSLHSAGLTGQRQ